MPAYATKSDDPRDTIAPVRRLTADERRADNERQIADDRILHAMYFADDMRHSACIAHAPTNKTLPCTPSCTFDNDLPF
jgi:hypothetical protein